MTITDDKTSPESLLNLLNSLRLEIKNLRTEINHVEETLVRERLRHIEDTLSQKHLSVYVSQRSEKLNEDINSLLNSSCKNKQECLSHYIETIENNSKIIKESGTQKALSDLDAQIAETELMVEKTKGKACEACFSNFNKRLKNAKKGPIRKSS